MSDIKEEIGFEGSGLNWDDDRRLYRIKGDSEYRLNIIVGEDGSNGVITNSKGNNVVTYKLGGSNTYSVIGSCYDALNRYVYYWVFSQPFDESGSADYEYDNRLLRFDEESEVIDLIFLDTHNYFGLHPNYPMRDPFIIGDWLYFNPQVSEPKMIDVVRAYNYTNFDVYDPFSTYVYSELVTYFGGLFMALTNVGVNETPVINIAKWERVGDAYADNIFFGFDSEFRYAFNVLKTPPIYRPQSAYSYDVNRPINNVKNKVFRFSYRYKYFDNSYSVFSSYSDVTLPSNLEQYNGQINSYADNYIQVRVFLPSAALVKEVELVFQTTEDPNWRRAKIISRQDIEILTDTNYTFSFYNDESYPPVDNTLVTNIYDAVPRTASSQEVINKNILTYGYCKEGFNNLDKNDIAVSLTPEMLSFVTPNAIGILRRDNVLYSGGTRTADADIRYTTRFTPTVPREGITTHIATIYFDAWWSAVNAGDIYSIMMSGVRSTGVGAGEHSYTIQPADVVSLDALVTAIGSFIGINYTDFTIITNLITNTVTIESLGRQITILESRFFFPGVGANEVLYKRRGFKTGSWHPFCQFYYDGAMRRWDAQTSKENLDGANIYEIDGTTVYVPMLNEVSPPPNDTANRWVINWEVSHLPPSGAKYWRWGYAGNSLCSYFVQYIIAAIASETTDPPDSVRIDITPLQTLKDSILLDNQFPQSIIDPYGWSKGDRVRFITTASGGGDLGAIIDGVYDFEIIKFDITNNYIYVQNVDFNWAGLGLGAGTLIEIYRPLNETTETKYYEFGEIMPIIEDTDGVLVHGGQHQDQDSSIALPATGVFDTGDIYHITRTPSLAVDDEQGYFHESRWWSDFYDSDDWDKGKIGVETMFNERYLNIIRFSYPYLQNTQINGLSTFDGLRYKELNDIYGKTLRLIEIGDTLKVYQRKKPSSILIGRTEYSDAEGNTTVTISDKVLGAIRYSSTNYGTEFPESISRNNRYVYGFDIYNGVFWRDSANGIFPISGRYEATDGTGDYKMDSYFKQKAKALLLSGIDHIKVMTVWDERYKNLFVIFKDSVDESNDETIVFHEPSNRWICFTEFDKTPAEGWNEMLELSYSIVKGFEGGLGYEFDDDIRFAIFNIGSGLGTPQNINSSPVSMGLVMTMPAPVVTATCDIAPVSMGLVLTMPTPTVTPSSVHASDEMVSWFAEDDGYDHREETTFTMVGSTQAEITYIPLWITVTTLSPANPLSVTEFVYHGQTIGIYPVSPNEGPLRTDDVSFRDVYGNICLVNVTQSSSGLHPNVDVQMDGSDTSGTTLYNVAGTATNGSYQININFTPDNPAYSYGIEYSMGYTIYKEGVLVGSGTLSNVVDEVNNIYSGLWMSDMASAAQDIIVYLTVL